MRPSQSVQVQPPGQQHQCVFMVVCSHLFSLLCCLKPTEHWWRHRRPALQPRSGGRHRPLPPQGDHHHGQEEDRQEVQDQGLCQGVQLQPPDAHQVSGAADAVNWTAASRPQRGSFGWDWSHEDLDQKSCSFCITAKPDWTQYRRPNVECMRALVLMK